MSKGDLNNTLKKTFAKNSELLYMYECKRKFQFKQDLNHKHTVYPQLSVLEKKNCT